jgi:hypothetical protein
MLVTSALKQRHSSTVSVSQTYAGKVVQSFKYPFSRPTDLASHADHNLALTRGLLTTAGAPDWLSEGPIWTGAKSVTGQAVLDYLQHFLVDDTSRSISLPLLCAYIERQLDEGELVRWTVAVKGRNRADPLLGTADWGVPGGTIAQIRRTRLRSDPNSIGVVTEPGDEEAGLDSAQIARAREITRKDGIGANPAARSVRAPAEGLLLIYPISRHSGHELPAGASRQPLFENPNDRVARDLIAFALSFPPSERAPTIFGQGSLDFVTGTVAWRAVD